MALSRVARPSVHDGVRESLKRFIAESGLRAGDRLPGESELAARLGIGRPAVREALPALEAVGAVLDAVARLTDADLADIARLQVVMRRRVEQRRAYAAEDFGMHRTIMRHVDNRLLAAMLDAVYALTEARLASTAPSRAAIMPERSRIDLAQHQALTDAVLSRDGRLAQRRLIDHFETTANRLGFAPSWRALRGEPGTGHHGWVSAATPCSERRSSRRSRASGRIVVTTAEDDHFAPGGID